MGAHTCQPLSTRFRLGHSPRRSSQRGWTLKWSTTLLVTMAPASPATPTRGCVPRASPYTSTGMCPQSFSLSPRYFPIFLPLLPLSPARSLSSWFGKGPGFIRLVQPNRLPHAHTRTRANTNTHTNTNMYTRTHIHTLIHTHRSKQTELECARVRIDLVPA